MKALNWAREAAIYQIFPDRFYNGDHGNDPAPLAAWTERPTRTNFFGGDLAGIRKKLAYIETLGANTIYLTPIFSAPSNHKYDTRNYYQVDAIFGGDDALRDLVSAVHDRGMRLILDGVFNHCGEEFFAFQDVLEKGQESDYSNWFTIHGYPLSREPLNYMCCGDAHYLPKLNHHDPEVTEYFLDVAEYWTEEMSIDGWRLDVPFKVPDHFWRKFRKRLKAIDSELFLFGEVWRKADVWLNGDKFDGVTNYPLRELILDYCNTGFLDAEDYLYETRILRQSLGDAAYTMVNLLGSHDTPRLLSVFGGDVDKAILAWVLLLTEVGIPLVYYGDEAAMEGGNDPDCRRPMVWEEDRKTSQIFDVIQSLLALRKESSALTNGSFENLFSFVGLVAYKRKHKEEEIIVIVNAREPVYNIRIPVRSDRTYYYDIASHEQVRVREGKLEFDLFPAHSYMILSTT